LIMSPIICLIEMLNNLDDTSATGVDYSFNIY